MALTDLIQSGELTKMQIYGCTDDDYIQYDPPEPLS